MNADKVINPYNPSEVLMETRASGITIWRIGPYRFLYNPMNQTLCNEFLHSGSWYVVDSTPIGDYLEHIADGTYPKSNID
jgi:hypothetical protein